MSIKKKTKGTIKPSETPEMSLTRFWLLWLAEYAPRSVDEYTKLRPVTVRDIREKAERIVISSGNSHLLTLALERILTFF